MAVQAKQLGIVVVATVVLAGLVVYGARAVSESKARAREAAQATEAAERGREAERQALETARIAAQKKRDAAIAALASGDVSRWTVDAAVVRETVKQDLKEFAYFDEVRLASLPPRRSLCPAFWQVHKRPEPKDEFALRERANQEKAILEKCIKALEADLAQSPKVMVAECSLEIPRYDFARNGFTSDLADCRLVGNRTWYVGTHVTPLVLEGADSAGVVSDRSLFVEVEEAKARSFKARHSAKLKLEVAFEPGEYGETNLSKPRSDGFDLFGPEKVKGVKGQALAFRVVSSGGPMIDWTPYRNAPDGKGTIAKVIVDPSPSGSNVQELRARMAPNELEALRVDLSKARAPRRWTAAQQARYIEVCLKAKANEPSLNRRVCGCNIEMVMQRFRSLGAYGDFLTEHKGDKPDPDLAGWFASCSVAFGD